MNGPWVKSYDLLDSILQKRNIILDPVLGLFNLAGNKGDILRLFGYYSNRLNNSQLCCLYIDLNLQK